MCFFFFGFRLLFQLIQLTSIFLEKCAKRLTHIIRKEQLVRSIGSAEVDTICDRSGGDLRAAINEIQLRAAQHKHSRLKGVFNQINSTGSTVDDNSSRGDVRISSVHCIAKIIHGSKKDPPKWNPESLAAQCEMGVDGMACFLQHNAVEFYSECDELAAGLNYLSDADLFISRQYDISHVNSFELIFCFISPKNLTCSNKHIGPRPW